MPFSLPDIPALFMLAAVNVSCPPQATPLVDIVFDNKPYVLDNTVTQAALQNVKGDTHVAQKPGENFKTVGTAVGEISAQIKMNFKMLSNRATQQSCIWTESARIYLSYNPKILIVRNYRPGSCRYRTTFEHELRHVNTDLITLKEFAPVLRDAVKIRSERLGVVGPVPRLRLEDEQRKMHAALEQTLKIAMDKMMATRQMRQQQIDTRAEYLRLSKACPGEDMPE